MHKQSPKGKHPFKPIHFPISIHIFGHSFHSNNFLKLLKFSFSIKMSIVHSLRIPIEKSFVSGFLHANSTISEGQPFIKAGVVLVSGAGGGVYGPTGIWMSLATRLAQAGVPTIRLDYRRPNHTQTCVADLEAAIHFLHSQFGIQIVGLVGWSFGSAPVFTIASKMMEKGNGKIVRLGACATVAAQTADSFGIRQCSPNVPILLVHGTNDRCLSFECSMRLKAEYDRGDPGKRGKCEVLLMEGDDHCLTHQYARAEQHILDFLLDALLGEAQQTNAVDHSLVPSAKTGLDWMQRGHDLGEAPDGMGERESVNEPTRHQKND